MVHPSLSRRLCYNLLSVSLSAKHAHIHIQTLSTLDLHHFISNARDRFNKLHSSRWWWIISLIKLLSSWHQQPHPRFSNNSPNYLFFLLVPLKSLNIFSFQGNQIEIHLQIRHMNCRVYEKVNFRSSTLNKYTYDINRQCNWRMTRVDTYSWMQ